MTKQPQLRYFAYHDGHDPTYLRIGNLVLDFAHPKDHRPYYHEATTDLFGTPPWATKDSRTDCILIHQHGLVRGFDIGATNLLNLGSSSDKNTFELISGKTGSMIELIEPHEYFENVVLKSEKAQKWLQTRLTVANDFTSRVKSAVKPTPKVWLLTGLYLMSDVSQRVLATNTSGQKAALHVPVPDPSGFSALAGVNVGGSISSASSEGLVSGSTIKQEKVWAAQWQRVRVKKVVKEKWEATLQNEIRLLETFSLTTERGEKTVPTNERVQVDLGDAPLDLESEKETLDHDDWAEFEEGVDELETPSEPEQKEDEDDENE